MARRLRLGGVMAVLLALAGATVASAAPSITSSSAVHGQSVEVIHLTGKFVQQADLDLGPAGDSLGDQFLFTQDLFRRGAKVGVLGGNCTIVSLERAVSVTFQCLATARLPGGQLATQGMVTFSEATAGQPFQVAITGGTGAYRTAHGLVVVTETATEDRLTLRIIR